MKRFWLLLLITIISAACNKSRESGFGGGCSVDVSDALVFMQASSDVVEFRGDTTSVTLGFELSFQYADRTTLAVTDFAVGITDAQIRLNNNSPFSAFETTTTQFNRTLTEPGSYRVTIDYYLCSGDGKLSVATNVFVRPANAPLVELTAVPDPSFGIKVGEVVKYVLKLADKDGSVVFNVDFDPDAEGDEPAVNYPNHNASTQDLVFEYQYQDAGIYEYTIAVSDPEGDTTILRFPAVVGLVPVVDALISSYNTPVAVRALPGYASSDSEAVWAVAAREGGLRLYQYDVTSSALRFLRQPYAELLENELISDFIFEPVSRIGYVVANKGLYAVDLTDLTKPKFRTPLDRHYPNYSLVLPVDLRNPFTIANGKYAVVGNSLGALHILRFNPVEMNAQRDSGQPFDEKAVCQLTNTRMDKMHQCECSDISGNCSTDRYAERLEVRGFQSGAYVEPYLLIGSDASDGWLLDLSETVGAAKPIGQSYSFTSHPVTSYPSASGGFTFPYAITGQRTGATTIDWYAATGINGLAFLRQTNNTIARAPEPYHNFEAYIPASSNFTRSDDDIRGVAATTDQVLIGTKSGDEKSAILALSPERWYDRASTDAFFEYPYVQKCNQFDLRDTSHPIITTEPLYYLRDCVKSPLINDMDTIGLAVGTVGADSFTLTLMDDDPASTTQIGNGRQLATVEMQELFNSGSVRGNKMYLTSGFGGIEIWQFEIVDGKITPFIVDGFVNGENMKEVITTDDSIWINSRFTAKEYKEGGDGKINPTPVRDVTLSHSSYVLRQANNTLFIKGSGNAKIEKVNQDTGAIELTSIRSDYSTLYDARVNGVLAERFSNNETVIDLLSTADLSIVASLTIVGNARYAIASGNAGSFYALQVTGSGETEETLLTAYSIDSGEFVQRSQVELPQKADFGLDGIALAISGDKVLANFNGKNRGLYLLKDDGFSLSFIGSSLITAMAESSQIFPITFTGDLGVAGLVTDGFSIGNVNIVKFSAVP